MGNWKQFEGLQEELSIYTACYGFQRKCYADCTAFYAYDVTHRRIYFLKHLPVVIAVIFHVVVILKIFTDQLHVCAARYVRRRVGGKRNYIVSFWTQCLEVDGCFGGLDDKHIVLGYILNKHFL